MATKLLKEQHGSGVVNLNSDSVPAVGEALMGERMPGERMPGEMMHSGIMPGAKFVDAELRGGPETILLVEDEDFVRKVAAVVLESAGYELIIARSGAEALDVYGQLSEPVDLLLADVVMPGMSGRDLAAEFDSLCPRARVLLMSGHAGQLARCQGSGYGTTYLAKPFSVRTLLKRVREVLDTNPFGLGAPA